MSTKQHTILVVDDDPENLRVLGNLLKDSNYKVRAFSNGAMALESARRKRPDIIMLDIRMPDMDGFEVCARLKKDPELRHVPVLFLSALDDPEEIVKAFGLGGADYITKPFRYQEVQARIGAHVELALARKSLEKEVAVRRRAEQDLLAANENLEQRVAERTKELLDTNAVLAREIEKSRKAEEALRESEQRYRTIVDTANEGIFTTDADLRFTYLNQKMADMFTLDARAWKNRFLTAHVAEEEQEALARRMAARRQGKSEVYEAEYRRADGRLFNALVSEAPLMDGRGRFSGLISMVLDITDRKLAEEELKRAYAEITLLKSQLETHNTLLREEILLEHNFQEIIGHSPGITDVLRLVEQVAPAAAPVLISGEPGVGKELIARAMHSLSQLKDKPLVKLNCASLGQAPASRLTITRAGEGVHEQSVLMSRFEAARGATLFLSEVGALPLPAQAALLRAMSEGRETREVRILASTSRNLREEVESGAFLYDLYCRLNVFPLFVPPLRERFEDLEPLVRHFVAKYGAREGREDLAVPRDSVLKLREYGWPGNVQELEQTVKHSVVVSKGRTLRLSLPGAADAHLEGKPLKTVERDLVMAALEKAGWKINGPGGAAELLGMHPNSLRYRLKKWNITRPGK